MEVDLFRLRGPKGAKLSLHLMASTLIICTTLFESLTSRPSGDWENVSRRTLSSLMGSGLFGTEISHGRSIRG